MTHPSRDDLLVEIRGLTKRYPGVVALDSVDFELRAGEVHAVVGHNGAGKSTLVKIIAGDTQGEASVFRIGGRDAHLSSPADAIALGVRIVTQDRSLVAQMSVAENVLLGQPPLTRFGLIDRASLHARAAAVLGELGVDLPLDVEVGALRPAEQALVEIARALSRDARILLLDEPTSAISETETERLFGIIRRLRGLGVGTILISHRVPDILSVADRITVLRDGRIAFASPVAGLDADEIVRVMSGGEADRVRPAAPGSRGPAVLSAEHVSAAGFVEDVSLELSAGQILGVFGLVGSGAVELPYVLFGALPHSGVVRVGDAPLSSPASAVRSGVGFVPADRSEGLFHLQSMARNIGAANLAAYSPRGLYRAGDELRGAGEWVARLAISPPLPRQRISTFSGGNQQKALVGRWLERGARVLLLSEPTRGVDVAARAAIHRLLGELRDEGVALMLASTDLDEVVDLADRVLVLARGRVTRELSGAIERDDVLHAAAAS